MEELQLPRTFLGNEKVGCSEEWARVFSSSTAHLYMAGMF